MKTFAVLQLAGCAGCEVSLLNADEWSSEYRLAYMPLVISAHDLPEVDLLLVSGGVRNEEDLYNLRRAAGRNSKVIAIGTCAISGGVPSLGDRDVLEVFLADRERYHVPRLLPKSHPIDAVVKVDRYLSGRPPTPELFMALLTEPPGFKMSAIVCIECGRKKLKDMRPNRFVGFQSGEVKPGVCLLARINMAESMGTPRADGYLKQFRYDFGRPAHAILLFDLARGIELIYAIERAMQILSSPLGADETHVPFTPRDGEGFGLVEAPLCN